MLKTAKAPTLRVRLPEVGDARPEEVIEARYSYCHGEHELLLLLRGADDRHVVDVTEGEAEFALISDSPLILIGARLGGAIPWSLASYCWHLTPRESRVMPPAAGAPEEVRIPLAVVLADPDDGAVRATRCATLSLDFTRAMNEAIREQARMPFDPTDHARAMADLRRRCPTPRAAVARAICRAVGSR